MRLTRRERSWAIGLALCVVAYLAYTLLLEPAWQHTTDLQRVIPEKLATLEQVQAKAAQYLSLQQRMEQLQQIAQTQSPTALTATVEQAIDRAGLTPCLTNMTSDRPPIDAEYTLETVTADLKSLPLEKLFPLISSLRTQDDTIHLRLLQIQKAPTPGLWNASLQVARLKHANPTPPATSDF